MLHVCRSCLLRLGQPWRTSTRERPLRQLLPRTALPTFRAVSAFNGPLEQSQPSVSRDDSYEPQSDDPLESTSGDTDWHPTLARSVSTDWDSVLIRYIPKPLPKPVAKDGSVRHVLNPKDEDAKTFVFVDRRIQFINEMDGAEDPKLIDKLVSRFRSLERHQQNRLLHWAPRDLQQTLLYAFAQWKTFVKTVGPGLSGAKSEAEHRPGAEKMLSWIQNCQTVEEMVATLPRARDTSEIQRRDSGLLMLALQNAPDKAHMVLESIFRDHMPHSTYAFYLFEDTLELLAARIHWDESIDKCAAATELADLISLIMAQTEEGEHFQPFQSTLWRILYFLPPERLQTWYEELQAVSRRDAFSYLFPPTELQFASRFAKSPQTKTISLGILRRLKQRHRIDINGPVALSISTSILTFTEQELKNLDSSLPTPADVFAALRELGLKPNKFTYNAILRALCVRGDNIRTPLEVFEVMKNSGLKPDAFTYAILVNGCRRSEAYEVLADIAVEAFHAGVRSRIFWNDVLYAIYNICHVENVSQDVYRSAMLPMNDIFTRIFDVAPLRPFIPDEMSSYFVDSVKTAWFPDRLQRLHREIPALPPRDLIRPGLDTVCIFILCMVRSLPQPYDIVMFYVHFKKLLREGHPDAVRVVQELGSYVYDVILRSLVSWKGTMRIVLDIVRDMRKDDDENIDNEADSTAEALSTTAGSEHTDVVKIVDTVRPPRPSVYTWSILVKGFVRNNQVDKAEQCIDLMRQHGVEPNLVTWNTLAFGYAYLQDARGVVHTMQRLESAGFEADDWTMKAFSHIRNKGKAIEMMEQAVEANKLAQEQAEELTLQLDQQSRQREDAFSEGEDAEATISEVDLDDRFQELDPDTTPADVFKEMMNEVNKAEQGTSSTASRTDDTLAQLDVSRPHAIPERFFKKYINERERLKSTAPIDEKYVEHFEKWGRIRDEGLASAPQPRSVEAVERLRPEQQS